MIFQDSGNEAFMRLSLSKHGSFPAYQAFEGKVEWLKVLE